MAPASGHAQLLVAESVGPANIVVTFDPQDIGNEAVAMVGDPHCRLRNEDYAFRRERLGEATDGRVGEFRRNRQNA